MPNTTTNENKHNKLWHSLISGAAAGTVATYSAFIFESCKKKKQSRQLISWNIRELYRGSSAFGFSLVPCAMIQTSCNHLILKYTNSPVVSAIVSGGIGAIASTFAENIILEQQRRKIGPIQAIKNLYNLGANMYPTKTCGNPLTSLKTMQIKIPYTLVINRHKSSITSPDVIPSLRNSMRGLACLWTGFSMIAIREAIYGSSMLLTAGMVYDKVNKLTNNPYIAFASLIPLGIAGSLISHAPDTVATHKQCERKPISIWSFFKNIYKQEGIRGFYKGGLYRCGLFTTAMVTSSFTKNFCLDLLDNANEPNENKSNFGA